jgi:hypothetical protein
LPARLWTPMVPQGMDLERSAIRQWWKVNRSGDRHRLESDRVVSHCGSKPRPSFNLDA